MKQLSGKLITHELYGAWTSIRQTTEVGLEMSRAHRLQKKGRIVQVLLLPLLTLETEADGEGQLGAALIPPHTCLCITHVGSHHSPACMSQSAHDNARIASAA